MDDADEADEAGSPPTASARTATSGEPGCAAGRGPQPAKRQAPIAIHVAAKAGPVMLQSLNAASSKGLARIHNHRCGKSRVRWEAHAVVASSVRLLSREPMKIGGQRPAKSLTAHQVLSIVLPLEPKLSTAAYLLRENVCVLHVQASALQYRALEAVDWIVGRCSSRTLPSGASRLSPLRGE